MWVFGQNVSWLRIRSASLLLIHPWSNAHVASIYAMEWWSIIVGREGLSGWFALRDLVCISLSHLRAIVTIYIAGHKQIITAAIAIRLTRDQFKIILLCFFRIRRISCAWMIQCTNDMEASITLLVVVMLIGLMFIPRSGSTPHPGLVMLILLLGIRMMNTSWCEYYYAI